MNILNNLDLLSVGVTVAAIGILGFTIYFTNRKSISNKAFLLFSIITVFWSLFNYLQHNLSIPVYSFWILRIVVFFAVWHAFSFAFLFHVFPKENLEISGKFKYFLLPLAIIVSLLTLTKFVFQEISEVTVSGKIVSVVNGPAIPIFAITVVILVITGVVTLIKKTRRAEGVEKNQFRLISIGTVITFALLITFNFFLPAFFSKTEYIPLGALFIFPFVLFTSYAILKHNLFDIKVVGTAFLTFILAVVSLIEIVISQSTAQVIFRSGVFILVLIFGINLLKGVLKEVRQREQIQKLALDLEKANVRLKELDQMKTEFVSLATHQIRAPLTAIKGYVSLIQEGDYGEISPEVKGAVNVILNETNALVTIVGDFLDVSRIEQGRMKYEFSDFDLEILVEEVNREYKPNIEKKGLQFTYSYDNHKIFNVHGDRGKLKQVIGNILDNSIKYTPHGTITMSMVEKDGKGLIKIADTGVGIPISTIPKLFQKFTRATNANETNILGTGLGLYVAKNMVESMKGRVWAESEGEGKGSQFYIELPLISGPINTSPTAPASQSVDILSSFKADHVEGTQVADITLKN